MTDLPQLHPSGLAMYLRCGMQYYFREHQKLKIPPGVALHVGICTHKSIATNLSNRLNVGEYLSAEACSEVARDWVNIQFAEQGVTLDGDTTEKKARGEAVDTAVGLSVLHAEQVAPQIEPVAVEKPWVMESEELPFQFAGTIDTVATGGVIIDAKTAGKSPAKTAADDSEQLTAYAWAQDAAGEPSPCQALDYLVKTKIPKHVRLTTTRGEDDYQRLLRKLDTVATALRAGIFLPAAEGSWWCSARFCGYYRQGICPYARKRVQG